MRGVGGAQGPGTGLQGPEQGENRRKEKLCATEAPSEWKDCPRRGSVRTMWTPTSSELPKAAREAGGSGSAGCDSGLFLPQKLKLRK